MKKKYFADNLDKSILSKNQHKTFVLSEQIGIIITTAQLSRDGSAIAISLAFCYLMLQWCNQGL